MAYKNTDIDSYGGPGNYGPAPSQEVIVQHVPISIVPPFDARQYHKRLLKCFARFIIEPWGLAVSAILAIIIVSFVQSVMGWSNPAHTVKAALENVSVQLVILLLYVGFHFLRTPWKVHQELKVERNERTLPWLAKRAKCIELSGLYAEIVRRWPDSQVAKFPTNRFVWGPEIGDTNIGADIQAGIVLTDKLREYLGSMQLPQLGALQFRSYLEAEERDATSRIETILSGD